MHPIVDGIEIEYSDSITVYRLDYRNPQDQRIANAYAIRTHPVLLAIDTTGAIIKRWDGVVSATELRESLQDVLKT